MLRCSAAVGQPVVVKMHVTFNLLAALLPHLAPLKWQQEYLDQASPLMLEAMLSLGSLTALAGDVGAVGGAAWRTVSTMLQSTLGNAFAVLRAGIVKATSGTQQAATKQA
jgi:hypothetical protein